MTGLLVSVRSAEEARLALSGGAHLIDVKEPRRGSLGAASRKTWNEVAAAVGRAAPLSAALGELLTEPLPDPPGLPAAYRFAKVGLAGCGGCAGWQVLWQQVLAALPTETAGVAVVYADWKTCHAPEPRSVMAAGIELGCRALLFDTFDKSAGDLFCHLEPAELARLARPARAAGMAVVLAGSLSPTKVPQALELEPDFLAVRGAVCTAGRSGPIVARRVRELAAAIGAQAADSAAKVGCA